MKNKWIKLAALSLFSFITALLVTEAGFRAFQPIPASDKEKFLSTSWVWASAKMDRLSSPFTAGQIAHPFWGSQLNSNLPAVNNYGFRDSENYPYARKNGETVIGLFGASVAEQVSDFLKEEFKKQCSKPVKILNFAVEGHKQPQAFHIFNYFIENIDLSINVDGHNDTFDTPSSALPWAYPLNADQLFFLNNKKYDLMAQAFNTAQKLSRFVHFVHQYAFLTKSDILYRGIKAWHDHLMQLKDKHVHRFSFFYEYENDLNVYPDHLNEQIINWKKFILHQDAIANLRGKKSYFFLQPSQYAENSKIFSEEERKVAFTSQEKYLNRYKEGYKKLRVAQNELSKKGIRISDFSALYAKETQPLFVDNCCHTNSAGKVILAQSIVKRLIPELGRRCN